MVIAPLSPASAADGTLTGTVTYPGAIGPMNNGSLELWQENEDGEWDVATETEIEPADGSFTVTGPAGWYEAVVRLDVGPDTRVEYARWVEVPSASAVNLEVPLVPITVTLIDGDGDPAYADVTLDCPTDGYDEGPPDPSSRSGVSGTGTATVWGVTGTVPCTLEARYDGTRQVRTLELDEDGDEIELILESHLVSGTVGLPGGAPDEGYLSFDDSESGETLAYAFPDPADGGYSVRVPPGTYRVGVNVSTDEEFYGTSRTVTIDADRVLDFSPVTTDLRVHVVDGTTPTSRKVEVHCTADQGDTYLIAMAVGDDVTLPALPDPPWGYCLLNVYDENGTTAQRGFPYPRAPGPTEGTFFVDTGAFIHGDPQDAVDADGVDAQIEALGPRSGDGNKDGEYDYLQDNVTTLPVLGLAPDFAAPFLTVVGPVGTSLSQVSTLDGTSISEPPPAGVSLPAGLVEFTLQDVPPGSDQVVELWPTTGTSGITGYAKYDPDAGTWSLLPAGRVQVFADHVAVTLTDGGIGDSDGVANGRIVDPGGLASVDASADTTPPVVTGEAATAPNANGWYDDDVSVVWSASDDTSVVTSPADTTVTGEGANLSATSAEVCDDAGNCAIGTVAGIRIDRTPPVVDLLLAGDYTLGAVPATACTATDTLSGVDGTCSTVLSGGNANGTGLISATSSARDLAGNGASDTGGYRVVYRFDGFDQPVNDPRLVPSQPMSVFRKGSTVAVSFVLRDASGQVVTPTSAPRWLAPSRGSRTRAQVNESVSKVAGTTGSLFQWRSGRWRFDWSTRGVTAGYVYTLRVLLDDGTVRTVEIGLR